MLGSSSPSDDASTSNTAGAAGAAAQTPSEVLAPDGLRANRITFSPIMDVLGRPESTVTDAQLEQLADLPLESIWSTLGEYRVNYVRGFTSTQPGARVAGRALTMRFLPPRPDLVEAIATLAAADWTGTMLGPPP